MPPVMSSTIEYKPRFKLTVPKIGGLILFLMFASCIVTLPTSLDVYDSQDLARTLQTPDGQNGVHNLFGTDILGRSLLWRCLLGGAISLGIGMAAATISVVIGTTWGLIAGYSGGRVDSVMMRIVDVLYGLPYILLVVLLSVALQPWVHGVVDSIWPGTGSMVANIITLLLAIGSVSWLTLARVVRGQVLSIKSQPFVEAAHAIGCSSPRILIRHMLPNLIGPIIVYTTLTVPEAILQESFLSFLGIGVQAPLPSWGNLASEGLTVLNPVESHWWLLAFPCALLGLTLMALNFLGDGLRDRFDPRSANER